MTITTDMPTTDAASTDEAAPPPTGIADGATRLDPTRRIDRLNTASLRRVIEPDTEVPGGVGPGRVIPAEMLSIADLGIDLTDEQIVTLSREELASLVIAGIRFEALLMSGFTEQIAYSTDLTDPRMVYMLHEVGEETRHSRLFIRLLGQLAPTARNAIDSGIHNVVFRLATRAVVRRPATLCVLVLAGEEIPDLLQKKMAEHPETDPFVKAVSRYHRQEEARHLAYARMVLPELWAEASVVDRLTITYFLPVVIGVMFDGIVHPGVYRTVGLPGWRTWRAAAKSAHQITTRHEAIRPVLAALVGGGIFRPGRVPFGWRRLCGVDRNGEPVGVTAQGVVAQ